MYSQSQKRKAIELREKGYSYTHISRNTGFSKSTLSDWLTSIPYKPNKETMVSIGKARAMAGERKRIIKNRSVVEAREKAKKDVGVLTKKELFLFGVGLYLGEGSKTHDNVRVSNSDPKVILLAIAWFKSLGLQIENFFLTIHLYPDSDIEQSLQFWSKITSIPRSRFGKVQIDLRQNKLKSREGKLPYGTAHLSVRSGGKKEFGVFLARRITGWIEEVQMSILRD